MKKISALILLLFASCLYSQQINLRSDVKNQLPIANGGTGSATAAGAWANLFTGAGIAANCPVLATASNGAITCSSFTQAPAGTVLGIYPMNTRAEQVSIDASGNVWTASWADYTLRSTSPSGAILHSYTMAYEPDCAVVDPSGNIWVCNQQDNSLTHITQAGIVIGTYPVAPGGGPDSLSIDTFGNVWATNSNLSSVSVLNNAGALIGTYSTGSGSPWNTVIDALGNVWTDNWTSGTVSKISPSGVLLGTFTVGNEPQIMGLDSAGNLWVPNQSDNTVTKLNSNGVVLFTKSVSPLTQTYGLAIDGAGNVWVYGKSPGNNVVEMDSAGSILGTYNTGGVNPDYAAVDHDGNIWFTNADTPTSTLTKMATGYHGIVTPMVANLNPLSSITPQLHAPNTFTVSTQGGSPTGSASVVQFWNIGDLGSVAGNDVNFGGFTGIAGSVNEALNIHQRRVSAGSTLGTVAMQLSCDQGNSAGTCGFLSFLNGNMGVGLPDPSEKLESAGNIKADSAYKNNIDVVIPATAQGYQGPAAGYVQLAPSSIGTPGCLYDNGSGIRSWAACSGAGSYTFTPTPYVSAFGSAVTVKTQAHYNVQVDGAMIGNGVTDDEPAFAAAVTAVQSGGTNPGSALYMPCGTYYFHEGWVGNPANLRIDTDGKNSQQTIGCVVITSDQPIVPLTFQAPASSSQQAGPSITGVAVEDISTAHNQMLAGLAFINTNNINIVNPGFLNIQGTQVGVVAQNGAANQVVSVTQYSPVVNWVSGANFSPTLPQWFWGLNSDSIPTPYQVAAATPTQLTLFQGNMGGTVGVGGYLGPTNAALTANEDVGGVGLLLAAGPVQPTTNVVSVASGGTTVTWISGTPFSTTNPQSFTVAGVPIETTGGTSTSLTLATGFSGSTCATSCNAAEYAVISGDYSQYGRVENLQSRAVREVQVAYGSQWSSDGTSRLKFSDGYSNGTGTVLADTIYSDWGQYSDTFDIDASAANTFAEGVVIEGGDAHIVENSNFENTSTAHPIVSSCNGGVGAFSCTSAVQIIGSKQHFESGNQINGNQIREFGAAEFIDANSKQTVVENNYFTQDADIPYVINLSATVQGQDNGQIYLPPSVLSTTGGVTTIPTQTQPAIMQGLGTPAGVCGTPGANGTLYDYTWTGQWYDCYNGAMTAFPFVGANNLWTANQTMAAQGTATSGENYGAFNELFQTSTWNGTSANTCNSSFGLAPGTGTNPTLYWSLNSCGSQPAALNLANLASMTFPTSTFQVNSTSLSQQAGLNFLNGTNTTVVGAGKNVSVTCNTATAGTPGCVVLPTVGMATLSNGTVTVTRSATCTPSATCVYKLTNCGAHASPAIGVPSIGTVTAGTSFVINSLNATGLVTAGDISDVCWQIN